MVKAISAINSIVKRPAVRNFATATMLTIGALGVGACGNNNSGKEVEQNNVTNELTEKSISNYLDKYDSKTPNIPREVDSLTLINALIANNPEAYLKNFVPRKPSYRFSEGIQAYFKSPSVNGDEWTLDNYVNNYKQYAKDYGAYSATALSQYELSQHTYITSTSLKNKEDYTEADRLNSVSLDLFCNKIIASPYANDVLKALDSFVEEQKFISNKEKRGYYKAVKDFQKEQSQMSLSKPQAMFDLIAFKTNKIAIMTLNAIYKSELDLSKSELMNIESKGVEYTIGYGASTGKSSNKTAGQTQTEVVSREGADALKAMNAETPLYSNEINKQVYDKTLTICPKEEIESVKEALKGSFSVAGTFLATADAQRVIDMAIVEQLEEKVDSYVTGKTFVSEGYTSHIKPIREAEAVEFTTIGCPSAQIMSKRLDTTFYNLEFVTEKQKKQYDKNVNDFQKKQSKTLKGNVETYSNLIAYKTYLIDKAILEKELENCNAFAKILGEKIDTKLILAEFEKAAAPTP